jgi:hypothetical protein
VADIRQCVIMRHDTCGCGAGGDELVDWWHADWVPLLATISAPPTSGVSTCDEHGGVEWVSPDGRDGV